MIANWRVGLAFRVDANAIALLSRDAVEYALPWAWTPNRVRRSIADRSSNVVAAHEGDKLIGFAIAEYDDDEAHLVLLAVLPSHRRKGVAMALINWLDQTFMVSGIARMRAEVREISTGAREFYRAAGFREERIVLGYYLGIENAVLIVRNVQSGST